MNDKPQAYPTMVSKLIHELQEVLDGQGDMPVYLDVRSSHETGASLEVGTEPDYYDGGILLPAEDAPYHCSHWVRNKKHRFYPQVCAISADGPYPGWDEDPIVGRDTIDGEPVKTWGSRDAVKERIDQESLKQEAQHDG